MGRFRPDQNILMHSVMYRTEVLRKCGMVLPKHTFYVDNIFVYQPLPYVKSMYYHGSGPLPLLHRPCRPKRQREHHGKRVDQQLRVTRHMIDCQDLDELKDQKRLHAYMVHYRSVMMAVSDIFLLLDGSDEAKKANRAVAVPQGPRKHRRLPRRALLGGLDRREVPRRRQVSLWACTASCARSSSSTDCLKFTPSVTSYAVPAPSRGSLWQNGTLLLLARASLRSKKTPRPGEVARKCQKGNGWHRAAMTEGVSFICPTGALCRGSIFRLLFVWADSILDVYAFFWLRCVFPFRFSFALIAGLLQ